MFIQRLNYNISIRTLTKANILMVFIICFVVWQSQLKILKSTKYPTYVSLLSTPHTFEQITTNSVEIVIISVTNADYRQRGIQQQNASLYCYACHHPNYRFISIDINQYYVCAHLTDVYFVKPCIVLMYMIDNPRIEWILALDADMGVVNLTRRLENYLPAKHEKDIHIIFYERYYGEIQTAGYLIRNHPWSHRFLSRWLEWIPRIANLSSANGDNGALHMHILDAVEGVSQEKRNQCWRAYQMSVPYNHTYPAYIGCVKCALGGRWEFRHIRILRRGHGFARDPFFGSVLIADHDLFIHGDKNNMIEFYTASINIDQCCKDTQWQLPLSKEIFLHNMTELRRRIAHLDESVAKEYWMSIGISDISHCWPHCTSIPNEYWRQQFLNKVCLNDAWQKVFNF